MEINIEKINTNPITAERILGMYKIDRQDHVSYEHYLKSKKLFESKINNSEIETKNENLLLETKNKILKQPENKIATYIVKALEDDNIEIQRIGASLVENAPKDQREDLYILVHKKVIWKKLLKCLIHTMWMNGELWQRKLILCHTGSRIIYAILFMKK